MTHPLFPNAVHGMENLKIGRTYTKYGNAGKHVQFRGQLVQIVFYNYPVKLICCDSDKLIKPILIFKLENGDLCDTFASDSGVIPYEKSFFEKTGHFNPCNYLVEEPPCH